MRLVSLIGRLLIIPVALSGICLSMYLGVPMAGAMETDHSMIRTSAVDEHAMVVVNHLDHKTDGECCRTVKMEHNTQATTSDTAKSSTEFFTTDVPLQTVRINNTKKSERISSSLLPPHNPISLAGIVIKRE